MLDTDCDPDLARVGVPINDDSKIRVQLFLGVLVPRVQEGRRWWLSNVVKKGKVYSNI
jgi:ribosomal protein S2